MSRREIAAVRRAIRAGGFFVDCWDCGSRIEVGGGEGFYVRRLGLAEYFGLTVLDGEGAQASEAMKRVIRGLFGDRCVGCGERATTLDHILPRAHGGLTEIENLQPMCESCNADKRDTEVEEVVIDLTFPLRPPPGDGYEGAVW